MSDNDITINHLRKSNKLRKLVRKDLKKLGLDNMSDNSVNSDTELDSKSGSAEMLSKSCKKHRTDAAQKSHLIALTPLQALVLIRKRRRRRRKIRRKVWNQG